MTIIFDGEDVESFSWYNCRLKKIIFPNQQPVLSLEVDYLLSLEKDDDGKFHLIPVIIQFKPAYKIIVSFDNEMTTSFTILSIRVSDEKDEFGANEYLIETDSGTISMYAKTATVISIGDLKKSENDWLAS